jgi:glycosyltransferase involved in cell wall biosynthesis
MRLGFVGNSALFWDGQRHSYKSGEWRYLEKVAPLFDVIDVCAYVKDSASAETGMEQGFTHGLKVPNGAVHNLLDHGLLRRGKAAWLGKQMGTFLTLSRLSKRWDFAFIVTPGWPALFCWWFHRRDGWPYAVSARLDWAGAIQLRSGRPRWMRLVLMPYTRLAELIEYQMLRDAAIRMVSGQLLLSRYPEFAQSTLSTLNVDLGAEDFRIRLDTCQNEDQIRVVYVGRLVKRKAVDVIIRAVASLLTAGQRLQLHIIGDGPEQIILEKLCESLSIHDSVVFHGYIPRKEVLLDELYRCDMLVIASFSEGFPRVIYEAMSQSLPVIATRVGGIPGLLDDGETALLVPSGDVECLAKAIRRVIQDGDLRRRLVQAGYAFALGVVRSEPIEMAFEQFQRETEKLKASF